VLLLWFQSTDKYLSLAQMYSVTFDLLLQYIWLNWKSWPWDAWPSLWHTVHNSNCFVTGQQIKLAWGSRHSYLYELRYELLFQPSGTVKEKLGL